MSGAYVGVKTKVPIYETAIGNVNIKTSNISKYFTVTNGTYYFEGSGSTFTTNNGGVASSTASTTLTALQDMEVSFSYSYSSESGYDKFTLVVGGTTVANGLSGATTTKTYSGSITAGQTILFKYAKDGSANGNDDKCTFSNMVLTTQVQKKVGTEIKDLAKRVLNCHVGDSGGIARKVAKGYVGDANGIARLFYTASAVHIHSYIKSEITFDDTEDADQHNYTKTCSSCGNVVDVWEEHEYVPVTQNATCLATGYTKDVCDCGKETNYVELPIGDHTEVAISGYAATCSAVGRTDGTKCSVCEEIISGYETIDKLPHTEQYTAGYAATCTGYGRKSGYKCSVCDTTISGRAWISPLGHAEETIEGYAATCTTDGLTDGVKCTRCGEIIAEQTVIAAPGHFASNPAAGSCTEGIACDRCGEWMIAPGSEHLSLDGGVVTKPTCTTQGYTTYTCNLCKDTIKSNYVAATGHNMQCITAYCDNTWLWRCSNCRFEEIKTTGLLVDESNLVHKSPTPCAERPATCTVSGSTGGSFCAACGKNIVPATVIQPLGHDPQWVVISEPSCTMPGSQIQKCTRCGEELSHQLPIPATGHDWFETGDSDYTGYEWECARCAETVWSWDEPEP